MSRKAAILFVFAVALIVALVPAITAEEPQEPPVTEVGEVVLPDAPAGEAAEAPADAEVIDFDALLGNNSRQMIGCPFPTCDDGLDCRRHGLPDYCPLGTFWVCSGSSGTGSCDGSCGGCA